MQHSLLTIYAPPPLMLNFVRWKKSQLEGLRAELSYCRKHFLNRTALITIEVTPRVPFLSHVMRILCLIPRDPLDFPAGCEARADEDDGTGRFLVPLLV